MLIGNLYLIAAQMNEKNSLPKIFGYAEAIIISGSMQPAIAPGDLIIIKEQEKYEKNDIVTYRKDQIYITHRVVDANSTEVITRGDANNVNDDPVSLSEVEGKVVLCIPAAGKIILSLKEPKGIIVVSLLVLMLYLISSRGQGRKRLKK